MPNQIHDMPTPKDFGLDFNYESWGANTEVTLCNVPWNSDYRDVFYASGLQAGLNTYLENVSGPKININTSTQLKFGQPIDLEIPFNIALEHNYIRVQNAMQPIPGDRVKSFYYFIQHVEYVAPSTTRFYIQLDAWQTFIYEIQFGNCFVKKGHVGIANENSFDNNGRDYLTVPEGMDVGGEYQIVDVKKKAVSFVQADELSESVGYRILVVSTVALEKAAGDVKKPILNSATGSLMQYLPNGSEIYLFNAGSVLQSFLADYSEKPWVTQGIISIQAIPRNYPIPFQTISLGNGKFIDKVMPGHLDKVSNAMFPNWRDSTRVTKIPYRYRNLKKFMTYPYSLVELTSYSGTPILIKPESWNDPDATVIEVPHFAPPNARLAFYPYRYNAADSSPAVSNAQGVFNDGGEFLDMMTGINNFPTFSTVNNSYAGYLASNANSLNYQHSSADYSQQKALNGAQLSQNQSNMGISASQDMNKISVDAQYAQTNLSNNFAAGHAAVGAISDIAGGAMMGPAGLGGGVAKAAMSGVSTAMNIAQSNMATGISAGASMDSNARGNALTGQIADSNKGYADSVAKGDYANTIAGINAKVQDAKMIQNTTSGQMGGESFLLANYQWGYDMKIKLIDNAALRLIGEYWLRYGYNIGTFMRIPSDFRVMSKFSYWELKETYIISSRCPEEYRQTIRGILEKGVTVWSNPADIGTVDIGDNVPLGGISY